MSKQTTPARRRTSSTLDEYDRLMARLERIEAGLRKEQPQFGHLEMLPDPAVIRRLAEREYGTLNDGPVRAHQQIVRNLVRLLGAARNPEDGGKTAVWALNEAISATEDLAIRAGFFVGMARGMAWMGELATLPPKSAKPRKAEVQS